MTNLKDVAKRAGVSISTVSRTLAGMDLVKEETKNKVLEAIKELNFQPNAIAKSLREGKTNTVALIVPNITTPIFPIVAQGVEACLREYGFTVILANTDEDPDLERKTMESLRKRMVDGFIIITCSPDPSYLEGLKEQQVPIVQVLRPTKSGLDTVIGDNFQGAYKGTQYLIQKGHRKIALINGANILFYEQRYDGYVQALIDNGIPFDPLFVKNEAYGVEGGYQKMQELLADGIEFSGVFATSDVCAIGVIKALKEHNLEVPRDVSVLGYDNLDIGSMFIPGLTTVAQPAYEMGINAANILVDRIRGGSNSQTVKKIMEIEILERETVVPYQRR